MKKIIFYICILLNITFAQAIAQDSILKISNEDTFYNPASKLSYLIDIKNELKISEILDPEYQEKFHPFKGEIPAFGLVSSGIWLKFTIQNHLDTSPYLEVLNPALDTVEYFLFNNDGLLVHHHLTGDFEKIRERSIQSWQFLQDMKLESAQVYTCYLKYNAETSTTLSPLRIAPLKKFYEAKHTATLWQGLYFGLILFMVIYNLFLFFSLEDRSYLFFGLFIICTGMLFALLNGFGIQFLWRDFPQISRYVPLVGSLAEIFIILFTSSFLHARIKTPKLYVWLLALISLNLVIIGLNIAGVHFISTQLLIYNSILVLFFIFFVAIKSWGDGYEPSKYFLLSWSFFVAGFIIFLLRENGLIASNSIIGNILQISSTVTILFISFALSKKINIYIDRKNEAQELALFTALENEKLVSDQNQLLEAMVHQRTIDLEQSISTLSRQGKDLHEANAFKDKVFSIISHDLKSPISTLAGLLKLMKIKSLDELERTKVVESLEVALKGTKNLLDNILAWANKHDKNESETDEIKLYNLVEEILELFQYQADTKGIRLLNHLENEFHIYANKNMLQLVLRNLISNAIKFTPKGGKVDIIMQQDYLDLLLIVKDSGVGMSAETLTNLFRANKHTSTRGTENEKGTGLGLILCKEFVDKYNGKLFVESEPGKGSKFTIKLRNAIPVLETVFN